MGSDRRVEPARAVRGAADLRRPRIRIDPEFRALIPPLTLGERSQLEENIVAAGRATDPLMLWNDVLLDGHNRLEICTARRWPFTTTQVRLTYLLFLKMAHEQTQPPWSKPNPIPKGYDWPALDALDGDALETHYRHTLEMLGKQPGMLGVIFRKSQNKIQDPAKLKRLISDPRLGARREVGFPPLASRSSDLARNTVGRRS